LQVEQDEQFAQASRVVEAEEHAQIGELVRLGQTVQIEEVEQVLIAAGTVDLVEALQDEQVLIAAGTVDVVEALEDETALHTMALLEPSVPAGSECGYRGEMSVLTSDQTSGLVRMFLTSKFDRSLRTAQIDLGRLRLERLSSNRVVRN